MTGKPGDVGGFSRRSFLKGAGGAAGLLALAPSRLFGAHSSVSKAETVSVLVDVSRCIGCRSCMRACNTANRLPGPTDYMDISHNGVRTSLAFDQWTVVNREGAGEDGRYVKRQCMHCLDPACSSVCPVAALHQTDQGPVIYRESRCIGCRYCMIACPFDVPRFDWNNGLTPVIGKCQFCAQDRLFRGLGPACVEACPTGALKAGRRDEMLFEAHARLSARPDKYVGHVYGEDEVGGTSWLYISDVPFEELGFPRQLPKRPLPSLTWDVVSRLPAVIAILSSILGAVAVTLSRKERKSWLRR